MLRHWFLYIRQIVRDCTCQKGMISIVNMIGIHLDLPYPGYAASGMNVGNNGG